MPAIKHIMNAILGGQWAITSTALEAILEIASRTIDVPADSKIFHGVIDKSAILPSGGMHIDGTRDATLHGEIAVISLTGPIFPRANLFTAYSGAVDIQSFLNDYKVLQSREDVKGIIIKIDSPGGYITGIVEASDYIFSTRGKKPGVSYVYGMAASAAIWIGSSTGKTIVSATAELGSIGVVAAYRDTKEKDAKAGVTNYEIISSQSPNKREDPSTDSGRINIQKIVDELAEVFIERMALNRGTIREDVIENFGRGGMLVAQSAIDVGLADSISDMSTLIDEMNAEHGKNLNKYFTSKKGEGMPQELTLDILKADHPALYKTVVDTGFTNGVAHENTRIKDIEAIDVPGSKSVVDKLKFDTTATVGSVSRTILVEQAQVTKDKKALLDKDGEETAKKTQKVEVKPEDNEATTDDEREAFRKRLRKGASRSQ